MLRVTPGVNDDRVKLNGLSKLYSEDKLLIAVGFELSGCRFFDHVQPRVVVVFIQALRLPLGKKE